MLYMLKMKKIAYLTSKQELNTDSLILCYFHTNEKGKFIFNY